MQTYISSGERDFMYDEDPSLKQRDINYVLSLRDNPKEILLSEIHKKQNYILHFLKKTNSSF